ncbi:dTMP kinase [Pseudarthrobacter sp. N5]|uniref:dTMP kinase n=1 Tax=Pseudarthrobacter sp. N5 TaxID=3418416 RepID=UPI003CF38205
MVIHPTVARAFRALDESGLAWVLLRGEDDLARPYGDVDLLVAGGQLPGLDELMNSIGLCRVRAAGHGSHRFYFDYADPDELWVKLDVVSEISFGPLQQWRTSLAAGCLERRIRNGPFWLPAPADHAWLQLLHLVLDKGEIAPERFETARRAAAVASDDDLIAEYIDQRSGPGTAGRMLKLVRSHRHDEVPAMVAHMKSSWANTAPSRTRLRGARNRALRLLSPRLQGRGMVVGVMAPDGAGKTTLLHNLGAAFPIPSKYVYMGMWGAGPWDSWLRRVPGGRSAKKVFRLLRGGLAARYHRLRGRLVLMDRVPYDAMLPGSVDTSVAGRITNALAFRLSPEPDVLLVLDAPGEVMFARKGEHSAEVLENWRQAYLELADRLPRTWVLDADQPRALVQRLATEIVWRGMSPSTANPQKADPGGAAALSLHLWRLLDWRFLLPVLQPQSVGYGGTIGADMMSALRLLDPNAALIRSDHNGTADKVFEVVLLTDPDLRLFAASAAAVQPGGWMCAQLRRSFFRRSGPRTLKGWKRAFAMQGFRDVRVYWHAPTLDRPARIVPVASRTAVLDTLSLHEAIRFGKARSLIGRLALALRLFDVAIPEGTVTGRRPESDERK